MNVTAVIVYLNSREKCFDNVCCIADELFASKYIKAVRVVVPKSTHFVDIPDIPAFAKKGIDVFRGDVRPLASCIIQAAGIGAFDTVLLMSSSGPVVLAPFVNKAIEEHFREKHTYSALCHHGILMDPLRAADAGPGSPIFALIDTPCLETMVSSRQQMIFERDAPQATSRNLRSVPKHYYSLANLGPLKKGGLSSSRPLRILWATKISDPFPYLAPAVLNGHAIVGLCGSFDGPDVLTRAEKMGLPVIDDKAVCECDPAAIRQIRSLEPDLMFVWRFPLLKREIFDLPKLGTFNVHPTLLPKGRGGYPGVHCILDDDRLTGATIIQIDEGADTGDIVAQKAIGITGLDTRITLSRRLSVLSLQMIHCFFADVNGAIANKRKQVKVRYPHFDRNLAVLRFKSSSSGEILRLVRAFSHWATTQDNAGNKWTFIDIDAIQPARGRSHPPGKVISLRGGMVYVAVKGGIVRIKRGRLKAGDGEPMPLADAISAGLITLDTFLD